MWNKIYRLGAWSFAGMWIVTAIIIVGTWLDSELWPIREGTSLARGLFASVAGIFMGVGFALLIPSLAQLRHHPPGPQRFFWLVGLLMFPFITGYLFLAGKKSKGLAP